MLFIIKFIKFKPTIKFNSKTSNFTAMVANNKQVATVIVA